jgi:hypothetical protein
MINQDHVLGGIARMASSDMILILSINSFQQGNESSDIVAVNN